MNAAPGEFEDRLVGLATLLVVGSGAIVYHANALALWIAWWLGTAALAGTLLVLLNR